MSFEEVFAALKPIFTKYAGSLAVQIDKPGEYYLETKTAVHKGHRLQFGGVKIGKAYVSFHLMPIYMCPVLQASLSSGLRARMQGKACFNFKSGPEPELIADLKAVTEAGFKRWREQKWL